MQTGILLVIKLIPIKNDCNASALTWKNKFISFEQEVYQISCTRLREDDSETAALTILGSCRDTATM